MKKILFFLCVLCACSCTNREMQEKKAICQSLCDSLYVAETKSFKIIETQNTEWHEGQRSMIVVGTTPVPTTRTVKAKGSLMLLETEEVIRTNYSNVPVGASFVLRPVYIPQKFKDGNQKNYRPVLQKHEYFIRAEDKYYPVEDFDLFKVK